MTKQVHVLISIVIPCFRSGNSLYDIIAKIVSCMEAASAPYEIILVNDGSPDNLSQVIRTICRDFPSATGIVLARNFGQHAAIMAALPHVHGEAVVFMDDDGEHSPDDIAVLLGELDKGYDIVSAAYPNQRRGLIRKLGTAINNKMAEALIGKPRNVILNSYWCCRRFVVDQLMLYSSPSPYIMGYLLKITTNIGNVPLEKHARISGSSGYSLKRLIALWLNGFTAFSVKPLRISTVIGFFVALAGFIYGAYVIISRLLNPDIPLGYSSTMAVLLFIGGMIMVMLGLVGEYVGRIYISINKTPQYVVRETMNCEAHHETPRD